MKLQFMNSNPNNAMKKILVSILILFSLSSCKKTGIDKYELKYFNSKENMNVFYTDYSLNLDDTLVKSNNYSVLFMSNSLGVSATLKTDGTNDNLRIQIYKNKKLVKDTSAFTSNLAAFFFLK